VPHSLNVEFNARSAQKWGPFNGACTRSGALFLPASLSPPVHGPRRVDGLVSPRVIAIDLHTARRGFDLVIRSCSGANGFQHRSGFLTVFARNSSPESLFQKP
jgi:hypothetical protein